MPRTPPPPPSRPRATYFSNAEKVARALLDAEGELVSFFDLIKLIGRNVETEDDYRKGMTVLRKAVYALNRNKILRLFGTIHAERGKGYFFLAERTIG